MSKLERKQKILIGLIVVCAVCLVGQYFFFNHLVVEVGDRSSPTNQKLQEEISRDDAIFSGNSNPNEKAHH